MCVCVLTDLVLPQLQDWLQKNTLSNYLERAPGCWESHYITPPPPPPPPPPPSPLTHKHTRQEKRKDESELKYKSKTSAGRKEAKD